MLARSVLVTPLLLAFAGPALAQTATTSAPATEPIAVPGKAPDACRLLPQPDLEALFPGRPITAKGPTLSPIYRGPQYAESCMYSVKLPSPTSKLEFARFASLTVIRWDGVAKRAAKPRRRPSPRSRPRERNSPPIPRSRSSSNRSAASATRPSRDRPPPAWWSAPARTT